MDNLLFLLDNLKNDKTFSIEAINFTVKDVEQFKNINYNDYLHIITYIYLECILLDGNIDDIFKYEDEVLINIINETKKGNYTYLYTITKIKRINNHWIFKEHIHKFLTKLCSGLIPYYNIIVNNMLKNINLLDTYTNMILPLIIQSIETQLMINKLEIKINESNNRIEELENIIYYSPDFGSEYIIAKNNFEQLVANQK